jgi:hypothetical protein
MCTKEWPSVEAFLDDPAVEYTGFQPDFSLELQGLFYFTHDADQCGSTMAIWVETFIPIYLARQTLTNEQEPESCVKYCLDRQALGSCRLDCKNAIARRIGAALARRCGPESPKRRHAHTHSFS